MDYIGLTKEQLTHMWAVEILENYPKLRKEIAEAPQLKNQPIIAEIDNIPIFLKNN